MGARPNLDDEEQVEILRLWHLALAKGERPNVSAIARELRRDRKTVDLFLKQHDTTVPLAKAILRSSAAKLARQIVNNADVDQSMTVLRDRSLGVLEGPPADTATGPKTVIMIGMGPQAPGMRAPTPEEFAAARAARALPPGAPHG